MGIMTVGFGTGIYGFIPVLHNTQELHSASCLQDTWLSQVTAKARGDGLAGIEGLVEKSAEWESCKHALQRVEAIR
jgi:hypothetical protein